MGALVRYEDMRIAVQNCARIDEAADLRDKAAALQAYARQRDDRDLEVWVSEIRLRATVRIGELVRDLEKSAPGPAPADSSHRREVTPKADALADAGLSKSSAHRMEQLAGGRDERAQAAGKAAAETYFAKARQTREPATMQGLQSAVAAAVTATVGPPPARKPPTPPHDPEADISFSSFYASLRPLGERAYDFEALAMEADLSLAEHFQEIALAASKVAVGFSLALTRREASVRLAGGSDAQA